MPAEVPVVTLRQAEHGKGFRGRAVDDDVACPGDVQRRPLDSQGNEQDEHGLLVHLLGPAGAGIAVAILAAPLFPQLHDSGCFDHLECDFDVLRSDQGQAENTGCLLYVSAHDAGHLLFF